MTIVDILYFSFIPFVNLISYICSYSADCFVVIMSHEDHGHGHGGEHAKPSNPFFIIGFVLIIAFFALQSRSGGQRSSGPISKPVPRAIPTPTLEIQGIHEQGPTYQKSILNEGMTPPPDLVVTPQVGGIAPWNYVRKFQNDLQVILDPIEGSSYQQKHTIKTANLGPEGYEVEQAAVRLTPKEIQDSNLHLITYIQNLTANHTQCFYDEANGFEHHPDENIFKTAALRWNNARGGSKVLQSTMSTGKLPLEGFDLFNTLPDEKVTAQNGLKCFTQDKGFHTGLFEDNTGEEYYHGEAHPPAQWTPDLFCPAETEQYRECIAEQAACSEDTRNKNKSNKNKDGECGPQNCSLVCHGDAHTVYSTSLPGAMKEGDITYNIGYLENGDTQGYTYTQFDNAFNFNKEHGLNTQGQTNDFIFKNDVMTEESIYAELARIKEHLHAFQCVLKPKELQTPDKPCPTPEPDKSTAGIRNGNDAIEPREPAQCGAGKPISPNVSHSGLDAAITQAAAWASIPACVLKGIAFIEGATTEMSKATCIPNQCGAAGPFQISVGQDTCGKKTCDECGPNWKGRACNNETWALQKAGGTAADACNINIAAKAAAAIVDGKANGFGVPFTHSSSSTIASQKQSIITAADAYYGVTSPIDRLGGLSYGEYVYKTCDPTYTTHVDHGFPY